MGQSRDDYDDYFCWG